MSSYPTKSNPFADVHAHHGDVLLRMELDSQLEPEGILAFFVEDFLGCPTRAALLFWIPFALARETRKSRILLMDLSSEKRITDCSIAAIAKI